MPDAAPGGDSLYTTNFEVDTFTYFAFAMLTVEHELMMYCIMTFESRSRRTSPRTFLLWAGSLI